MSINGLPEAINFSFDGKDYSYRSNAEAARAHGIKPGTLSLRLKKGWSIEQALGLLPPPDGANTHKRIKIDGNEFRSTKEAIKHYCLTTALVYSRLRNGWSIEQALGVDDPPPEKKRKGKSVKLSVNKQKLEFPSVTEAAKYFNLKSQLVLQRINTYQWSIEQALELDEPPTNAGIPKETKVKKDGEIFNYPSLTDAVIDFGLSYDTVKQRINKLGWTIEQALELEPPPKHELGVIGYIYKATNVKNKKVYIGQTKTSVEVRWSQHIEAALKQSNNKKVDFHSSIKKYGSENFKVEVLGVFHTIDELNKAERHYIHQYKSTDDALGYNRSIGGSGNTGGQKTKVNGKIYESFAAAARAHGIAPKFAHQRLNQNGWTLEQALGINEPPENRSAKKTVKVFKFNKKYEFPSIKQAAKHFDVPYKRVMARLYSGWSIEEALELKPR